MVLVGASLSCDVLLSESWHKPTSRSLVPSFLKCPFPINACHDRFSVQSAQVVLNPNIRVADACPGMPERLFDSLRVAANVSYTEFFQAESR
jgi:hypothetical protein